MNKQRRALLDQITSELTDLQSRLESLRDEEQEAFDAIPDGLRESENAQRSESAADALDDAHTQVTDALTSIDEAVNA